MSIWLWLFIESLLIFSVLTSIMVMHQCYYMLCYLSILVSYDMYCKTISFWCWYSILPSLTYWKLYLSLSKCTYSSNICHLKNLPLTREFASHGHLCKNEKCRNQSKKAERGKEDKLANGIKSYSGWLCLNTLNVGEQGQEWDQWRLELIN